MFKVSDEKTKDKLYYLLSLDPINSFYMFLNLENYGIENKNVEFYVDDFNTINCVLMRYYNSCQVYGDFSDKNIDIINLIKSINPTIITGTKNSINYIYSKINNSYNISYGYTFLITSFPKYDYKDIFIPTDDELFDCAKLIQSDESIGSYYNVDSLFHQLLERRKNKTGRNYIIKQDNKIIAHIATYAENHQFASTSGLIVDKDFRQFPYGTFLESYLINELLSEGKKVVSFIRKESRFKYYKVLKVGNYIENGKLLRV